ncbi:hypothetical protein NDU88_003853, partial [Pleurodeles waltl]
ESGASIQTALSVQGRPCVIFTCPAVFVSEILLHNDSKTTQRRLRSHQPLSAMLRVVSPAACVDLPDALQ